MNGVGLVDEIDAVGKGSCEGEGWAQIGNLSPKSRCASDDKKAGGASKEINRDVAAWKLVDEQSDGVEAKASEKATAMKEPVFKLVRISGVGTSENHAEGEFGQSAQAATSEDPLAAGGMKIKEKNAGKKSQGDCSEKKADGSPAEESPDE